MSSSGSSTSPPPPHCFPEAIRNSLKVGVNAARSPVAKTWFFTLNNWTPEEYEKIKAIEANYLICVKEVGALNGVPHLHGVITFAKAVRRLKLSSLLPRAYWAPTRSREQAVNYCLKDDPEPFIKDNRTQGNRSDLDDFCDNIKESGLHSAILEAPSTYVKYHGGLDKLSVLYQNPRDPSTPPEVVWLYGPTGTGKSRYVHERETDLWVAMSSHKWWQGYRQQEAILFDDFRCNFAPFADMLRILDRYPLQAEVKGGSVHINSPRMYITSQFPPHKVYCRERRSGEDIRQLYRRLAKVILVTLDSDGKTLMAEQDKESLISQDVEEGRSSLAPGFTPPSFLDRFLHPT